MTLFIPKNYYINVSEDTKTQDFNNLVWKEFDILNEWGKNLKAIRYSKRLSRYMIKGIIPQGKYRITFLFKNENL